MKNNTYRNAVEHLRFSGDLAASVAATQSAPRSHTRPIRTVVIAAVLVALVATTAFGTISKLREIPANVETLGTAREEMTDAAIMEFTVSKKTEGVTVHYMKLVGNDTYSFVHGMLISLKKGIFRITDDYQLEQVQMEQTNVTLEKNDRVYNLNFSWLDTEDGVISNHRGIYRKDENGEIMLNATGRSGQWPVFLNVETGEIRDALPDWTASDFTGRIGYAFALQGEILVSTIVESTEMVDGRDASYNLLYSVNQGQLREIELPENYHLDFVVNDTLYYQDRNGTLYRMDENFVPHLVCDYKTWDTLSNGLLTVCAGGSLGILDVLTGETYVFDEIPVQKSDLHERMGYNAKRYGSNGRIALVQSDWIPDEEKVVLCSLGVLDVNTRTIKMLQIENGYDGYQNGWLDENRFAVIYRGEGGQFLCIYEFTD